MTTASTSMAAAPYQELATAPGRMAGTPRPTDLPVRLLADGQLAHQEQRTYRRQLCAFSLTSLAAQRDAEIEDGRSGQPCPPAPWWSGPRRPAPLWRSRAWPPAGSGPLDDPGLVPISGPESRSRTPAASGSSWSGFSPLALCTVTGDRFRRQDDG